LSWDDKILADETLQIPHPELMNRPFLLSLIASLDPDWRYPISGFPYSHLTVAEILHRLPSSSATQNCFMPFPQMMGIVNITPDSFSDGGKYLLAEKAVERIQELTNDGAAIIDLGAQSTRPGATPVSPEEEWQRLEPVLVLLQQIFQRRPANPKISLDTFYPEVIEKALQRFPIDWINDVEGGKNERLLRTVAHTTCKIVITHSLSIPATSTTVLSFDKNPTKELCDWAEKKIRQLHGLGISQDRIILDPGIGFGKSPYQSLELLRNIDALKTFGCEVLVGHSRKSFLKTITMAADRDMETIGISHHLLKKKIDYLRVHNVEAHQRSFTALAFVEGIDV
jgi:2-amino-4-hydroxy-6-hydroxymethyldihydropteridine diphosphokinase/dihydropteroate synthase